MARQSILEQPVGEEDVHPRRLAPVADHLPQEAAVMGHDLEVEVPDAAAGLAGAALVRLQLSLPVPEGGERVFQDVEQDRGRDQGPVRAEGEDGIALYLLDLQGRREPLA